MYDIDQLGPGKMKDLIIKRFQDPDEVREFEKGRFELLYRVYPNKNFEEFKYDHRVNLRNSIATLNLIEAPAHLDIGAIIEFKSQLYDKNGVIPFEDTFFI